MAGPGKHSRDDANPSGLRLSVATLSAGVLVDTNVISDVLYNDPVWSEWSAQQLGLHFIETELSTQLCSFNHNG